MEIVVVYQTIVVILLPLFLFLAIAYLFHLYYACGNNEVEVDDPPIGQVVIANKFARGSYDRARSLLEEVRKSIPGSRYLGIHYDYPDVVEETAVWHAVGAVQAEGTEKPEEEEVRRLTAAGFGICQLLQVESVVRATFPDTTFLFTPLAPLFAYPIMRNFVKELGLCAYPYLEVYRDNIIHFMVPLSRQGDFYVPEAFPLLEDGEYDESVYDEDDYLEDSEFESDESDYNDDNLEDGEFDESDYDDDDLEEDLSDSDSLTCSYYGSETEDEDLESVEENLQQEVGSLELENSQQEVANLLLEVESMEPANMLLEVGSLELENLQQEAANLLQEVESMELANMLLEVGSLENLQQEVGSLEPENLQQEVRSQEPENLQQEVGSLELENLLQEAANLLLELESMEPANMLLEVGSQENLQQEVRSLAPRALPLLEDRESDESVYDDEDLEDSEFESDESDYDDDNLEDGEFDEYDYVDDLENGEFDESDYDDDDLEEDLSDSNSLTCSYYGSETEDEDLESVEENLQQEVGSLEPENLQQEVGSLELENSQREAGSLELENLQQEAAKLLLEVESMEPANMLLEVESLEPENVQQEVGSLEPENLLQEVGSLEPENLLQGVGSLEPENLQQEAAKLLLEVESMEPANMLLEALTRAVPGQENQIDSGEESLSSCEVIEIDSDEEPFEVIDFQAEMSGYEDVQ